MTVRAGAEFSAIPASRGRAEQPVTAPTEPLGTTADFAANHNGSWSEGGETPELKINAEKAHEGDLLGQKRLARYVRETLQDAIGKLLPRHRCRMCGRRAKFNKTNKCEPVTVAISGASGTAHLRGVFVCGNVWICPTCATRVSEARRAELHKAVVDWQQHGTVLHMILTHPHTKWERLDKNLDRHLAAVRWMTSHRRFKELRIDVDMPATVRALEVTYGELNGWHPHSHMLLFLRGTRYRSQRRRRQLERVLAELWQDACLAKGLRKPSDTYGLKLEDGSYAANYVSKWGCAEELTKAHVKKGKRGSLGPWGLLHAYAFDGDVDAGKRFVDYAEAFKGKSQLRWSPGGRAELGLDAEKTDAELAENADDDVVASATISTFGGKASDFALVVRFRAKVTVLEAAEQAFRNGQAIQPAVDSVVKALRARAGPAKLQPATQGVSPLAKAYAKQLNRRKRW